MKQKIYSRVFVSYSWDSDEHKEEAKKLVQNLRSNGIDVTYDGDLLLGERLIYFMENSISNSDIVLFICTSKYKYRADRRIKGVGTESQIITGNCMRLAMKRNSFPYYLPVHGKHPYLYGQKVNWGRFIYSGTL